MDEESVAVEEAPVEVDGFDPESLAPTRAAPEVDEITVTGSASAITNVQDEASAVTAFSMDDLDKSNISNVETLAFNVPSLHVGLQGNQVIVTLRGIGTQNASANGEPGVAFNVDGVNFLRPIAAQVAFFDLEGVEVNRGPQGFGSGKNSNAGSILVTTRKPSDDFEFNLDVQTGSYNEQRFRGALNIPINEYARFRAAGLYHDRDGYIDNIFLNDDDKNPFDVEDWGFRTHLEIMPTENVRSLLSYNFYTQGGNGTQINVLPSASPQFVDCNQEPDPRVGFTSLTPTLFCARITNTLGGQVVDPDVPGGNQPFLRLIADESGAILRSDQVSTNTPASRDNNFWGITSNTSWDLPGFSFFEDNQLKFIGSFQHVDSDFAQDFDGVDISFNSLTATEDTDQISGEVQWAATLGDAWNFQTSLFYQQLDSVGRFNIQRTVANELQTGVLSFDGTPGLQDTKNQSYGFGLGAEWLMSESLTLALGGRYTKDVKEVTLSREQADTLSGNGLDLELCNGGAQSSPNDLLTPIDPIQQAIFGRIVELPVPTCQEKFRHGSGAATLEWRPWDEQLFYAGFGRGFKGGGFANQSIGQYKPEFIWAYNVGAKNSFFDGLVTMSTEAYFYDYKDLQLVQLDGVKIRTENADAVIFGLDFEANAQPMDGMNLSAKVGYLHARFRDFQSIDPVDIGKSLAFNRCQLDPNFACPQPDSFKGNSLPRSPDLTMTLSAEQTFYLQQYGSITPRIQYYWQDDTYYRPYNRQLDLQEAYHATDVKLTWQSPTEAWTVEGFVNNLENQNIYQNVLVGPRLSGSPQNAWYGPDRLWGLRVAYRY